MRKTLSILLVAMVVAISLAFTAPAEARSKPFKQTRWKCGVNCSYVVKQQRTCWVVGVKRNGGLKLYCYRWHTVKTPRFAR